MRKVIKKIATLVMVAAMAVTIVPATSASAATTNLIKKNWNSYFGASAGWVEGATGTLIKNTKTAWTADISSIGYGGAWGAQVFAEKLKYQKGQTYTLTCTLEASTDKWVLIKIEGDDSKAFDPARAALAFKWVQLKPDESQTVSVDVTLPKNYKGHLSVYFGIGGEFGDREDEKNNGLYEGLTQLPNDGDPSFFTQIQCSKISFTPASTTIKKVAAKKAAAKVTIKKNANAKKYVVQYSTKKSMGGAKKVKTSKTNVTIKKLTSGKKYYFRTAIINKNGVQSKAWSAKKSVKIK